QRRQRGERRARQPGQGHAHRRGRPLQPRLLRGLPRGRLRPAPEQPHRRDDEPHRGLRGVGGPGQRRNHQMWSFGSKAGTCDADSGLQGSIYASNTAPRPGERFRVAVGNQNLMQNGGRLLEGAWKHVTYTQALNEDGTTWTGTAYVHGGRYAQATNPPTPPPVQT